MADVAPLLPHLPAAASKKDISVGGGGGGASDHFIDDAGCTHLLRPALVSFAWFFDAQQTFINVFTDAPLSSSSNSIVSEWSLAQANPAVLGLPTSAYFAGCLAGGFLLATLADSRLGRKNMLVLSSLSMSLFAALAAAAPNLAVYAFLRFACGFARSTVGTSALVLSCELVDRRWLDRMTYFGFFCFTLGFLSLPSIAFLSRSYSWRILYLWTSIPCIFYSVLIVFFVEESPRWLLLRKRKDEAMEALKDPSCIAGAASSAATAVSDDILSSVRIIWEKRWACRRLAAMMIVGFGIGMVYYGMPFNLGNLGPNLYLSVTLNALAELPSSLIPFFFIASMNRRTSTVAFTAASGVCSLLCAAAGSGGWPELAMELASFFSACTVFDIVLVYSVELFPTCVRNSAIGMVRQAVVLGGAVAPVVVAPGRRRRVLSFGVFGLVIGGCGLFAGGLPETRGSRISDTMEEEEDKETAAINGPNI